MKYRGTITVTFEALKDMLKLDDSVDIISVGTSDDESKRDIFHINLSSKEPTQLTKPCAEGTVFCNMMYISKDGVN